MVDRKSRGAEFREVENRTHKGKQVRVVIASRNYNTEIEDLWSALTYAERIPRWFAPVTGDLKVGGNYQIEGNAGGTIERCDPPIALDLTWEMGGNVSWVTVRLEPHGSETTMKLEHIMPVDKVSEEHWLKYGPGATGVGWDLAFLGMAMHLEIGGESVDQESTHKWLASEKGKEFLQSCADAWGVAHIDAGEDTGKAQGMAARTGAFYKGE